MSVKLRTKTLAKGVKSYYLDIYHNKVQKTDIVYHLRRIKVNHPQRVKVSIAERMKVNH